MNIWEVNKIGMRWALRRKSRRTQDGVEYAHYREYDGQIRKWWTKRGAQKQADRLNFYGRRLP